MIALVLDVALFALVFAAGYRIGAGSRSEELEQLRAAAGLDPIDGQVWP